MIQLLSIMIITRISFLFIYSINFYLLIFISVLRDYELFAFKIWLFITSESSTEKKETL